MFENGCLFYTFVPITKQFEENIFSIEVFVSPVSERESLISFAIISITYDDSCRHRVFISLPEMKDDSHTIKLGK